MHIYFKLFNSIKDEHEIELAKLELESLVGPVDTVGNFADELAKNPLKRFVNTTHATQRNDESDGVRFQDFLTHEVAYGKIQGFKCTLTGSPKIERLVRRLGYTREIFIFTDGESWKDVIKRVFPKAAVGKNCNAFYSKGHVAVRIITNQYFLENCEYILKITPTLERERIDEFTDRMFDNLMRFIYRIPATSRARVGKRFLDYLAERSEPSLYLSHGLHPYKGKFHPKMTRALINIVHPKDRGSLIDNFAGSGTLLVEASMMGLNSFGVEINPMSVLMANAKCALMRLKPERVETSISKFLITLDSELDILHQELDGQSTLKTMSFSPSLEILRTIEQIAHDVYEDFASAHVLEQIIVARMIIEAKFEGEVQDLLKLGLAITISNLKGRKKKDFHGVIHHVMEDIYRRSRLFHYIKQIIPMRVGAGVSCLANTADFKNIADIMNIGGNVNSPPYSTALDYIRNDIDQLVILGMIRTAEQLKELEASMGGNPRTRYNAEEMYDKIKKNTAGLPDYAVRIIRLLAHFERRNHAFRLYAFYELIKNSLSEQLRVLKKGALIATVIGNNHFKLTDNIDVVANDGIDIEGIIYPVTIHGMVNNVKPIEVKPISGDAISELYGDALPVRISRTSNSRNGAQNGIYIEIENERVVYLLGKMLGFESEIIVNRYLEKSRRGNIRYESIVILRKP